MKTDGIDTRGLMYRGRSFTRVTSHQTVVRKARDVVGTPVGVFPSTLVSLCKENPQVEDNRGDAVTL